MEYFCLNGCHLVYILLIIYKFFFFFLFLGPYRRRRAGRAVQLRKQRRIEAENARTAHFIHCLANPHQWRENLYRPFRQRGRGRGRGGERNNYQDDAEGRHVGRHRSPLRERQN